MNAFDFPPAIPTLHAIEYLLLATACLVSAVGYLHMWLYRNCFSQVESERSLIAFKSFVRVQMLGAIAFIITIGPALLVGMYNGIPTLKVALPTYCVIFLVSRFFLKIEKAHKKARSSQPHLQSAIDEIIYAWEKKFFPIF